MYLCEERVDMNCKVQNNFYPKVNAGGPGKQGRIRDTQEGERRFGGTSAPDES